VISVRNLSKSFGSKNVLSDVSLDLVPGQIHALLGPNGSGKSTLIRCLSGAIRPDAGVITSDGIPHQSFNPRSARDAGTSVIYQNFSLVPTLSVTDNVFLGDELRAGLRIDRSGQRKLVIEQLERLGRPLDPDAKVGELSSGDRQIVEIIKALRREPSLLILDEPTAALGQDEIKALGETLKGLRERAMAILYITHFIGEVFQLADYVTVLRDGEVVLGEAVAALESEQVIAAIAPSKRADDRDRAEAQPAGTTPELELVSYTTPGIAPLTLSVAGGEVVGIFGLLGSGRTELLEGIYGIRKREGKILLGGRPYGAKSPSAALRAGVALVAGERLRQSIFPRLTALDNLLLPHMKRLARRGLRVKRRERSEFASISARLGLVPSVPTLPAWTFSGGNQQKLAVGRWLAAAGIRVLLLDEPTQGIDVGARGDLYRLVFDLARTERKAIIFTSSDPDETLALADRILVLRAGAVVVDMQRSDATAERLLTYAHSDDGGESA
jgi:ribose transport system ATP-binding protein